MLPRVKVNHLLSTMEAHEWALYIKWRVPRQSQIFLLENQKAVIQHDILNQDCTCQTPPHTSCKADSGSHLPAPTLKVCQAGKTFHMYETTPCCVCNWYFSVWALELKEGKITGGVFNSKGNIFEMVYLHERTCVGKIWEEFLMRGEWSYKCLRSFYYFSAASRGKEMRVLHQGATALKYATGTIYEQMTYIFINNTKSVNILKRRYTTRHFIPGAH